jgi:hypothetical protein
MKQSVQNEPNIQDYLHKDEFGSELEDRIFRSTRAGDDNDVAALSKLLATNQRDIASSPITAMKAKGDAFQASQDAAMEQGFMGTPGGPGGTNFQQPAAQAAAYARKQAEDKASMGYRQSEMEQGYMGDRQTSQNRTQKDVAEMNLEGQREMQSDYWNRVANLGGSGQDVRSATAPSKTGGGSVSFQSQPKPVRVSPQTHSSFTAALGDQTPAAAGRLAGARAAIIQEYPTTQGIKLIAGKVMADPSAAGLTIDQIVERAKATIAAKNGGAQLPPQEEMDLRDLITYLRTGAQ